MKPPCFLTLDDSSSDLHPRSRKLIRALACALRWWHSSVGAQLALNWPKFAIFSYADSPYPRGSTRKPTTSRQADRVRLFVVLLRRPSRSTHMAAIKPTATGGLMVRLCMCMSILTATV